MINIKLLFSVIVNASNGFFEIFLSKNALIIYIIIVMLLIIVLIGSIMKSEQRRVAEIKDAENRRRIYEQDRTTQNITKYIDKKLASEGGTSVVSSSSVSSVSTPVSHKEETNDGESRFYMLTEIDKSM